MRKRFIVYAAIFASCNVAAAPFTDADAKKLAMGMNTQLSESRDQLNKLIKAGNPAAYRAQVNEPLWSKLRAWPDKNLEGRAIFPYYACKEAALLLLQYGDAWALPSSNKSMDKAWREKKVGQFRESQEECSAAIKNPDMSLKDIR